MEVRVWLHIRCYRYCTTHHPRSQVQDHSQTCSVMLAGYRLVLTLCLNFLRGCYPTSLKTSLHFGFSLCQYYQSLGISSLNYMYCVLLALRT